jgi:phage tail P2-like protein
MIKSLFNAQIADGVPRVLREQPWVKALSMAAWELHKQTMDYIDGSQIYTAIDTVREEVLDALAVNWKIDWYDTGYDIDQKRRIVKTALNIRRTMGTVSAVKAQADAIYPGSTLEEWFDFNGQPGTFRMTVDVTTTGPGNTLDNFGTAEIERRLTMAKRYSSHLESMSYQIMHGIKVGAGVSMWAATPPLCGTIFCGTYPDISTLGWSEKEAITLAALAEAFLASPELCGTIPEAATLGYSVYEAILYAGAVAEVYATEPPECGTEKSGTIPEAATLGQSIDVAQKLGKNGATEIYVGDPPESGTETSGSVPQESTLGQSIKAGIKGGSTAAAEVYSGVPSASGTNRCGTMQ